jgi:hypothetical protein
MSINKLRNSSVGMKLGLGFGTMVIIAAALGAAGWLGVGNVAQEATFANGAA